MVPNDPCARMEGVSLPGTLNELNPFATESFLNSTPGYLRHNPSLGAFDASHKTRGILSAFWIFGKFYIEELPATLRK